MTKEVNVQPSLIDSEVPINSLEAANIVLNQDSAVLDQDQPVVTQPLRSLHEVTDIPLEEESDSEKRKRRDGCCFEPYASLEVEDMFFLCRCIARCCVWIGECTDHCCEDCAECIHSCCESNETSGDGDCCADCSGDGCDGCDCDCSCLN